MHSTKVPNLVVFGGGIIPIARHGSRTAGRQGIFKSQFPNPAYIGQSMTTYVLSVSAGLEGVG